MLYALTMVRSRRGGGLCRIFGDSVEEEFQMLLKVGFQSHTHSHKASEREGRKARTKPASGKQAKRETSLPGILSDAGHPGSKVILLEEEPALHHQVLLGNAAEVTTQNCFFTPKT